MAKQTFTTGQVLTAAQMTSLQQTAMGGGSATAKTASYTLVAADAGTVVRMNSASATTITVNTSLFAAGDTVYIQNIGAGVCTITAGTATVDTASSLALAQYAGGTLYFTAASASLFFKADGAAGGGGKVLQVVQNTYSTTTTIATTTMTDTGLTATITPSLSSSKVLVLLAQQVSGSRTAASIGIAVQLLRGASVIRDMSGVGGYETLQGAFGGATSAGIAGIVNVSFLDSPATTSATTYKTQGKVQNSANSGSAFFQENSITSTIILLEIGA